MRHEPIPITPALVKWARIRAGFSLDAAQESFKKIEAWESGEAYPTYPQLERMADKFKVPVAIFFFPEPPDVPPVSQSFRTLPEREFNRLPGRIQFLVRKAKAFQIGLYELTEGKNPSDRNIVRDLAINTRVTIPQLVSEVRKYLNIPFNEQIQWSSADQALKNWRQAFLGAGIFVFKDQFRESDFSGFCLYDEEFPLIYVNNTSAKVRQIFTLFHELAHLLFHTSGIDALSDDFIDRLPNDNKKTEVICNRFAAEYLLPNQAFEAEFEGFDPTETAAEKLANRFLVSRELIFRKFLDRHLISEDSYREKKREWDEQWQKRGKKRGGNPYWSKISYLGQDYINLAFGRYYQNRISETELAEYLDTKPKNLSILEEYVIRGEQR